MIAMAIGLRALTKLFRTSLKLKPVSRIAASTEPFDFGLEVRPLHPWGWTGASNSHKPTATSLKQARCHVQHSSAARVEAPGRQVQGVGVSENRGP